VDVDEAGRRCEFGEIVIGAREECSGGGGIVVTADFCVVFDEDDGVGPEHAAGSPELAEFDGFQDLERKRLRSNCTGKRRSERMSRVRRIFIEDGLRIDFDLRAERCFFLSSLREECQLEKKEKRAGGWQRKPRRAEASSAPTKDGAKSASLGSGLSTNAHSK